jgi:hypothetical protein
MPNVLFCQLLCWFLCPNKTNVFFARRLPTKAAGGKKWRRTKKWWQTFSAASGRKPVRKHREKKAVGDDRPGGNCKARVNGFS